MILVFLNPSHRWFERLSATTSFYAAFRPLFRLDRRWSASIPFDQDSFDIGSLRQSDPAQQIGVTRIGAHPVPEDICREPRHDGGMLCVTFLDQPERLVFVVEARINRSSCDLLLDVVDVSQLPAVLLAPKLFVLACIDEFGAYGEIVAPLNDPPHDQRLHAKLLRHLLRLDLTLLVTEGRGTRDHFNVRKP